MTERRKEQLKILLAYIKQRRSEGVSTEDLSHDLMSVNGECYRLHKTVFGMFNMMDMAYQLLGELDAHQKPTQQSERDADAAVPAGDGSAVASKGKKARRGSGQRRP